MIQYPLQFSAVSISEPGTQSPWLVSCGPQQSTCAVPPEFAGGGGGFSPVKLVSRHRRRIKSGKELL